MEQLSELLYRHGFRITTARKAVFAVLQHADKPLFIRQIVDACAAIDRTSVYRTLELFSQLGIVASVQAGWKARYELADPFKPHHHHLQCNRCGEIIAIELPELEEQVHQVAKNYRYTLTSHHIELHGSCASCGHSSS